jgi:hypothetical protein
MKWFQLSMLAPCQLGHGLLFWIYPMRIVILRKNTGARIYAATKVGIKKLRCSEIACFHNSVPTFGRFRTPENHTREACREMTSGESSVAKSGIGKRAIFKSALYKVRAKIGVSPLESAAGENTPLILRVGVDVDVKKSAIVPTAIDKSGPVKSRPVVDGPSDGFACGHEKVRILYDLLSDLSECTRHDVSSGLTV